MIVIIYKTLNRKKCQVFLRKGDVWKRKLKISTPGEKKHPNYIWLKYPFVGGDSKKKR